MPNKKKNLLYAFLCAGAFTLFICIFWSFYYDLNDDTLMKEILSGKYSGTPSGRNIQLLYPLGALLAGLYRLVGVGVPVYGVFLYLCQMGAFLISVYALFNMSRGSQRLWALLCVFSCSGLFLYEFVFVQYTVTAAMLTAAAGLWFLVPEPDLSVKAFWKHNILTLILVFLSVQLRAQMFFFLLPFIGLLGLFCWLREKHFFAKTACMKFLGFAGCMLAGVGILYMSDRIAYGSRDWVEFEDYYAARTAVYDFADIRDVPYEENKAFFTSIGVSEEQYTLLENYNLALDETITTDTLWQIAEYARENGLTTKNTNPLADCKYHLLYGDRPLSILILAVYAGIFVAAVMLGVKACLGLCWSLVWKVGLTGIVRSALWLFLLYRGRSPERVTHSLYLMEFVVLMGILYLEHPKYETMIPAKPAPKRRISIRNRSPYEIPILCMSLIFFLALPGSIKRVNAENIRREEVNTKWQALTSYMNAHTENFYALDVYSTVAYSEKLFAADTGKPANYDLAGGWMTGSPLTKEKYKAFAFDNLQSALLTSGHACFVVGNPQPGTWGEVTAWLPKALGGEYTVELIDSVFVKTDASVTNASTDDDLDCAEQSPCFLIYQITAPAASTPMAYLNSSEKTPTSISGEYE